MGTLINYRARKRRFSRMIFIALTFLAYAFAEENTQEQQSASAVASGAEPAGFETAAVVSEAAESADRGSTSGTSAPYSVECGQVDDAGEPFCYVDRDIYVGWRTFHAFCLRCHAQDAVGSTFAPNLLVRIRESDISLDLFVERLNEGFTGQMGVMPPWKDDPNVRKRYNELYAYLMARVSGALPPGRPKRKPKSN